MNAVFLPSANNIYTVGGTFDIAGLIYKTTNEGTNWTNQLTTNEPLNSVYFINDLTGYAAGGDFEFGATIFKTSNGGANWFQQNQSVFGIIRCISFSSSDTGYNVGFNFNCISKTTNAGSSWISQYSGVGSFPYNLFMLNSLTGYAVGSNGLILKTTNGGFIPFDSISLKYLPLALNNKWVYHVTCEYPPVNSYLSISIHRDTIVNGKRYFYDSLGLISPLIMDNWVRVDSNNGNLYSIPGNLSCNLHPFENLVDSLAANYLELFYHCQVVSWDARVFDDSSSFVLGSQRFKSKGFTDTNQLTSTFNKYSMNLGLVKAIRGENFPTSFDLKGCVINGVVYGDTSFYYTVSGTVRYEDNNLPVNHGYVKALSLNKSTTQIVTRDSTGIQTNGTYTLQHVPMDSIDIMAYGNDENSFVPTYHDSTIYWQNAHVVYPTSNQTNIDIKVFRVNQTPNQIHIGGGVFTTSFSPTGLKDAIVYAKIGNQFKRFSISTATGSYVLDSLSQGSYQVICDRMGFNGSTKNITLGSINQDTVNFYLQNIISVHPLGSAIPTSFVLYQNYPNPFNPATAIKFAIPKSSHVQLIIYDLLGRGIIKLVDEQLNAGTYKVDWNAANYASGLYFYKLSATSGSGDFTETKKLVLIK